ncbi:MAG: UDP-N-acetylmuramoyl-L-alanyl-D-glutamate--2,6-diaminopimelate ligase [Desulfonatronovibrio sp.]
MDKKAMDFKQLTEEAGKGRPVKVHSGQIEPGDIFVAMPGTRFDGAGFISDALKRGAAWVVAGPGQADVYPGGKVLTHENPALALGDLARAMYGTDRLSLGLIGITGTNGKTTTAYLLEHIFQKSGFKTGVIGTVNYRWADKILDAAMTTPDCLKLHEMLSIMDKDGVEMVIMEVSSHALDQNRACGIDFDAGVFTNLSQDHLDYHRDMEKYFQAKSKLFLNPEKKSSFQAVINADDKYGKRLISSVPRAMGFGLHESVRLDLKGRLLRNDRTGISLECAYKGQQWVIHSSLCGRHNGYNLLAAQGAALSMGLGPEHFACLESFGQTPGRLEKVLNDLNLDIYIDYAHTPDALENVCLALKGLDFERIIVVFGCGGNRDKTKRPLMGKAVAALADVVFLTSDNPRDEDPESIIEDIKPGMSACSELYIEPDRSRAIKMAVDFMKSGDALLVAGKGHETYQEVKGLRSPFSDVRVVEQALGETRKKANRD